MTAGLFALAGATAGVAEVALLARAARGRRDPLALLGRLVLVGATLAIAARAGELTYAVPGWAAGFVAFAAIVQGRLR